MIKIVLIELTAKQTKKINLCCLSTTRSARLARIRSDRLESDVKNCYIYKINIEQNKQEFYLNME